MKNRKYVLFLFLVVALFYPIKAHAQRAKFEPVFVGYDLPEPVDADRLERCIRLGLVNYGWRVIEDKPGSIVARFEKSGGSIFAVIRIELVDGAYTIQYVDSQNLDVDLKRKLIHRNYPRWIANLDKFIYSKYLVEP